MRSASTLVVLPTHRWQTHVLRVAAGMRRPSVIAGFIAAHPAADHLSLRHVAELFSLVRSRLQCHSCIDKPIDMDSNFP